MVAETCSDPRNGRGTGGRDDHRKGLDYAIPHNTPREQAGHNGKGTDVLAAHRPSQQGGAAVYVSGAHLAELLSVPPDTALDGVLGADIARRVTRWHLGIDPAYPVGVANGLENLTAVPVKDVVHLLPGPVSCADVAQWAAQTHQPDPHTVVADREAERAALRHAAREEAAVFTCAATPPVASLADVVREHADLFEDSEILRHIARFARARGAGSWATLGNVLVRAVLAVPHQVTLPPIIGGPVSLNPMLAVVGASGSGKDMAIAVADDAVLLVGANGFPRQWSPLPIGTGEGIGRSFAMAKRAEDGTPTVEFHCRSQLFGVRDIASLEALGERRGQTLVPELLKAAHGQELGHANATLENRVILPPHSYRLGLTAGVQPGNGSSLVSDQSVRDGLTQRFLWLPVRDGVCRGHIDAPDPLTLTIPNFGLPDPLGAPGETAEEPEDHSVTPALVHIGVWEPIAREIVAINAAKDADLFGRSDDPTKGHRMLAQLKAAAALAVLHGRTSVESEDWQRGAALLAVSEAIAEGVATESRKAVASDAAARGTADGHRYAAADAAKEAAITEQISSKVLTFLRERGGEWTSLRTAASSLPSRRREQLPTAVRQLMAEGKIEAREHEFQKGQKRTELRAKS
ncbi:hypothetical protein ACWDUL_23160 [Nocardia niigatensis]